MTGLTPPQARKLLAAALRSGEYLQGQGKLTDGEKFCCLGVACDLYRTHEGGPEWDEISYMSNTCALPAAVQKWLGLATDRGGPSRATCLSVLNDEGSTFGEIADLIESEPEGLLA